MNNNPVWTRAEVPSIRSLVILAALSVSIAACGGQVQPTPTPPLHVAVATEATLTPTRVIGAIQATQTPAAPTAESWKGTLETQGTLAVPGNPCHDAFTADLEFVVDSNGKVSGSGHATAVVPATCARQPNLPPVTDVILRIEGVKFKDRFELRLYPNGVTGQLEAGFFANWMGPSGVEPPIQVIPIVNPGLAQGKISITDSSKFNAGTTENTYNLKCANCS